MAPSFHLGIAAAGLLVTLLEVAGCGCESEPTPTRPEAVVAEFLERMQRVHGDRTSARRAYELLWAPARRNLAERAKRASAMSGRRVAPEEMLAPSRFSLRYQAKRYSTRIEKQWAEVTAFGERDDLEPRRVRLVLEENNWRIVLEAPPLEPIRRRPDAEPE